MLMNYSCPSGKKHSLDQLVELLKNPPAQSELELSVQRILKNDFKPYHFASSGTNHPHMVTALSLTIEHCNLTAFELIFSHYKNLHHIDVLTALLSFESVYLEKMISERPFKVFEYLLQIALTTTSLALFKKTLSAMLEIINLKGCHFLNERKFKSHDDTNAPQSALSAAASHHHSPLIEFFIKHGANPNAEFDGGDGASLLEVSAYHWFDKQPHAPKGLTKTCLTLIAAGAKLDNLSVDMKTQLLQAAIEEHQKIAAQRLLGQQTLNPNDETRSFSPFSLFSIMGQTIERSFFGMNAKVSALSKHERVKLTALLETAHTDSACSSSLFFSKENQSNHEPPQFKI